MFPHFRAENGEKNASEQPANTHWEYILSVCYERIGHIAVAQDAIPVAIPAFNNAQEILVNLAANDPLNAEFQAAILTIQQTLRDVAKDQKNPATCATEVELSKGLATIDPANSERQRELALNHNDLGDSALGQGDFFTASTCYLSALDIMKNLTTRDPGNFLWKRDLYACNMRLTICSEKQEEMLKAHAHAREVVDTLQEFIDAGKHLSPSDLKIFKDFKQKLGIE